MPPVPPPSIRHWSPTIVLTEEWAWVIGVVAVVLIGKAAFDEKQWLLGVEIL